MKEKRRFLALLLAFAMSATMSPLSAIADGDPISTPVETIEFPQETETYDETTTVSTTTAVGLSTDMNTDPVETTAFPFTTTAPLTTTLDKYVHTTCPDGADYPAYFDFVSWDCGWRYDTGKMPDFAGDSLMMFVKTDDWASTYSQKLNTRFTVGSGKNAEFYEFDTSKVDANTAGMYPVYLNSLGGGQTTVEIINTPDVASGEYTVSLQQHQSRKFIYMDDGVKKPTIPQDPAYDEYEMLTRGYQVQGLLDYYDRTFDLDKLTVEVCDPNVLAYYIDKQDGNIYVMGLKEGETQIRVLDENGETLLVRGFRVDNFETTTTSAIWTVVDETSTRPSTQTETVTTTVPVETTTVQTSGTLVNESFLVRARISVVDWDTGNPVANAVISYPGGSFISDGTTKEIEFYAKPNDTIYVATPPNGYGYPDQLDYGSGHYQISASDVGHELELKFSLPSADKFTTSASELSTETMTETTPETTAIACYAPKCNPDTFTLTEGETQTVKVSAPAGQPAVKEIWFDNIPECVDVVYNEGDDFFTVKGLSAGSGRMTVYCNGAAFSGSLEVTVRANKPTISPEELGDINGDAEVNAADAADALVDAAHFGASGAHLLAESALLAADSNRDGAVNAEDAANVLSYAAECGSKGVTYTFAEFMDKVFAPVTVDNVLYLHQTFGHIYDALGETDGEYDGRSSVTTRIFHTKQALLNFVELVKANGNELCDYYWDTVNLTDIAMTYTDTWFDTHDLVAVITQDNSTDISYELNRIVKNTANGLLLQMTRYASDACEPAIGGNVVLIETNKTDALQADVEFTDAKKYNYIKMLYRVNASSDTADAPSPDPVIMTSREELFLDTTAEEWSNYMVDEGSFSIGDFFSLDTDYDVFEYFDLVLLRVQAVSGSILVRPRSLMKDANDSVVIDLVRRIPAVCDTKETNWDILIAVPHDDEPLNHVTVREFQYYPEQYIVDSPATAQVIDTTDLNGVSTKRFFTSDVFADDPIEVFRTYDEWAASSHKSDYALAEDFFTENAIAVIPCELPSGSITLDPQTATLVEEDGKTVCVFAIDKLEPQVQTCDMAEWRMYVPIPQKFAEADAFRAEYTSVPLNEIGE